MTFNWQSKLEVSFVPLGRFKEDDSFLGFGGSSALIDFRGNRFICSALHVFVNHRIALQLRWDQKRMATTTVALFPTVFSDDSTTRPKLLDFAICDISHNRDVPLFQDLDQNGTGKVIKELQRVIYTEKNLCSPQRGIEYGFAGTTLSTVENHPAITIGGGVIRIVSGLSYIGDSDGFHQFRLPVEHPGHRIFEGCSGAPIIDQEGRSVAFVCGGDKDKSTIRGFPASQAKVIMTGLALEKAHRIKPNK